MRTLFIASAFTLVALGCGDTTTEGDAAPDAPSDTRTDSRVVLPPMGAEQRCAELGAACVCSEPLAAPDQMFMGSHNPPDSTSHECNGGNAIGISGEGGASTPIPNPPTGSSVGSVYRTSHGVQDVFGNSPVAAPTRRVCTRVYYYMDSDFAITCAPRNDCTCQRIKIQEFMPQRIPVAGGGRTNAGLFFQSAWSNDASFTSQVQLSDTAGNSILGDNLDGSGDSLTQRDCIDEWCRHEVCISAEWGSDSGMVSAVESRTTVVSDGREMTRTMSGLPVGGVNLANQRDIHIAHMFIMGDCLPGYRYVSHAMQAEWETDEGQWIGPACEMEGGCP